MGGKQAKQTNGNDTSKSTSAKPLQSLKSSGTINIPKLLISRKQAILMEKQ